MHLIKNILCALLIYTYVLFISYNIVYCIYYICVHILAFKSKFERTTYVCTYILLGYKHVNLFNTQLSFTKYLLTFYREM